jgi:hypothetical protein
MSKAWHERRRKEMGPEVSRMVDGFLKDQAGRRTQYIRNLELFEGRTMGGYSAHSYAGEYKRDTTNDRLRLIRSAVASAVSSIYAPQKPKPQFQTLGATWATRRKAYRLDRICEGVLNQRQDRFINVWAFMADAGVECAIQGDANIKVVADREQKRIVHELVPSPDLFHDPVEGRRPKSLFQRAPIGMEQALELFPKAEKAIKGAQPYEWHGRAVASQPRAQRVIEIRYAWRLPDSTEKPGMWCAVIGDEVCDDGDWSAPSFPFVKLQWEPHRDGPWASGIAEEGGYLAENAGDLDKRLHHREIVAAGKKIYYHEGTLKPDDLALNDALVAVAIEPGATFPQESLTPPFSPMELEYLQEKVRNFWDAIGISQVSAAARREQGVSSGVAMMTLNDTKAGRQLLKSQRYEQAFVDLAHQYVWRLRELAEEDPDFAVRWPGKSLLREVKWKDADVEDDDSFTVTVAPASALPHDPAGRQEMVQTMLGSGLISQETAKTLIGWPDLDSELNVENAEAEYIDSLIERYLDADAEDWSDGDYDAPEGFIMNKVGALRRFSSAWFRAKIDQRALPKDEQAVAEFNIALLVRYIRELDALMPKPAPAPMPGPAPDQLATPGPVAMPGPMAA